MKIKSIVVLSSKLSCTDMANYARCILVIELISISNVVCLDILSKFYFLFEPELRMFARKFWSASVCVFKNF